MGPESESRGEGQELRLTHVGLQGPKLEQAQREQGDWRSAAASVKCLPLLLIASHVSDTGKCPYTVLFPYNKKCCGEITREEKWCHRTVVALQMRNTEGELGSLVSVSLGFDSQLPESHQSSTKKEMCSKSYVTSKLNCS